MNQFDVIIAGGGAAGFFAAIQIAENNPELQIVILEKGKEVLSKVRISGGGRCNVTHAEFSPDLLAGYYPRGEKELIGPFHKFCSGDTMAFFEERGVPLKIEADGRIFPQSDSSTSIISCFLDCCHALGIKIITSCGVQSFNKPDKNWLLETTCGKFEAPDLMICTGSSNKTWKLLSSLGHSIVSPVPSLFTFNCKDPRINGLMGLSSEVSIDIPGSSLQAYGPLLITHWGFSGPAILRLSAWGARELHERNYEFRIRISWTQNMDAEDVFTELLELKKQHPKQRPANSRIGAIPKRLYLSLLEYCDLHQIERWADASNKQIRKLADELTGGTFAIKGKSTFKEEFVTAGGVDLKEVDMRTFESKLHDRLYFAGEVLNIDAITGGFNFQNAWTGAFIAARTILDKRQVNS
ncbi:NAD(P)/FAD-dependent oxidoreductase [Robertkochia solimangrovi]|uniref:NAD(P)/FAD-dependent oxidoreductase n=1 Tax=Robertkochia solimangrovi TaxID=2213046 RepID=UPI00118009E6|nr:NAD(P)/FAD-dependent oxidoreductase [Robertkochia solimangrovi]TRZ43290.1 aminoacetone oxidase family FAD-binding enzyme [Robertkochia solimangrovi]